MTIDINLIPASARRDGNRNANALTISLPQEVLIGVGAGLVFILVIVHLLLGVIWMTGMGRMSVYQAKWQLVQPQKTALDAIKKETGDLKDKINTISDVTTKKMVLWAPKFNAISDALPRGLWIRRMTLDKTGLTMEGRDRKS